MAVVDPQGRSWAVRLRRVVRPPFPGFGAVTDATVPADLGDVVWVVLLPPLTYLGRLVLCGGRGSLRVLRDRFLIVAETDRERWAWSAVGRSSATTLLGEIAAALRDGRELPAFGRFESRASSMALTESDVAYRPGSGHVRVVRRPRSGGTG